MNIKKRGRINIYDPSINKFKADILHYDKEEGILNGSKL